MENLQSMLEQRVIEATKKVEQEVDAALEKLEQFDEEDLKILREKRLKEMKKEEEQKREWLNMGHGEYTEVPEGKEFFQMVKRSPRLVCVFFRPDSERCAILDSHMKILCVKHLETKFIKVNVEKAPFLTERLKIHVIPTMTVVINGVTSENIVGFTTLGNCDDFSTEMLEWRLAKAGVINYNGDLTMPPPQKEKARFSLTERRKVIRGSSRGDSSDDEFLDG